MQMSVARAEHQEGTFRGPVVILADMDKSEMDEAVLKGLQGPNHLEVPASIQSTSNKAAHLYLQQLWCSAKQSLRAPCISPTSYNSGPCYGHESAVDLCLCYAPASQDL